MILRERDPWPARYERIEGLRIARDEMSRSVTPKKPSYSHLNGPAPLFVIRGL